MKLTKIHIRNYKSIKDLTLEIPTQDERQCLMFFGINETGKSNLLKAIALLDKRKAFNYEKDCEKEAGQNGENVEITYTFEHENEEILSKLKLPESIIKCISISEIQKKVEFTPAKVRNDTFDFTLDDEDTISSTEGNMPINSVKYEDYIYNNSTSAVIPMSDFKGVANYDGLPNEIKSKHQRLDANLLKKTVKAELEKIIEPLLPEPIYWKYSPTYLINDPINLSTFAGNTESCVPLRNLFLLINLKDANLIRNIDKMKTNSHTRLEIEKKLSKKATEHINSLWPDHPVDIHVRIESGMQCEVSVADKGADERFLMEERSDGFKQFISILLTLSVEHRTKILNNKIILLDEPENSLHPSSVRYLRDELLTISENNIVIVATHSIFMVDKKKLDRHYTVRKENGRTAIERVDPDNPYKDDVIYEALGTTIYEFIEPYMIIFEGSYDKLIFDLFTAKFKDELKPESVRSISASGAVEVPRYMKFFDRKMVTGLVVVDSDQEGKNAKREILRANADCADVAFELTDLVGGVPKNATLEDLFPEELVLAEATKLHGPLFRSQDTYPILDYVKRVKKEKKADQDPSLEELKLKVIHRIKTDVENLSKEDLEKKYAVYLAFLTAIHNKIKGLKKK